MYVHTYMYVYIYMYLYISTHMCVCKYACGVCVCVCVCVARLRVCVARLCVRMYVNVYVRVRFCAARSVRTCPTFVFGKNFNFVMNNCAQLSMSLHIF